MVQCFQLHKVLSIFNRSPLGHICYNNPKPSFMFVILESTLNQHHYALSFDTCFVSLMGDTSRPYYDRSLPIDISSLSRKLTWKNIFGTLECAYINGNIPRSQQQVLIIRIRPKYFVCVLIQLIYSHRIDYTTIPWDPLTPSVVFLTYVNGLHQWPVMRWCLPCTISSHLFAWLDSYIKLSSGQDRRPHI